MGTKPENTHGIQKQTQPNPYPKFGSGLGITLGYLNFGYPILAIVMRSENWFNWISSGVLEYLMAAYISVIGI